MGYLNNIEFINTEDKSVGLYSNNVSDIFHSKTGALKEAKEKFIMPIKESGIEFCHEINILDICYGIGYNTKSFLEFNSVASNVNIDALEYDKNLLYISPLINDYINDDNLKLFLINSMIKTENDFNHFIDISELMLNEHFDFLSDFGKSFIKILLSEIYKYNPSTIKNSFLHNIYYNYISESMNNGLKFNNYNNVNFNYYLGDARKNIIILKKQYDVVFLDAFSSKKDSTLWTIDFLSQVKSKMKKDSLLISYSKSTPFRSALIELGFFVGKTLLKNKDMGTVASLNKFLIKNPLNDYDLKIISSRSGIPYRDKTLTLPHDNIIKNRETESNSSDRISRTKLSKSLSL
ncbi:hypothetical protein IJ182_06160 [bacterium]|nr:hypothetical protein [bacterium]